MKCGQGEERGMRRRSRPARGAWVEIKQNLPDAGQAWRRAPQGARGLKYELCTKPMVKIPSRPARGA